VCSVENVDKLIEEKSSLVKALKKNGLLILNQDDDAEYAPLSQIKILSHKEKDNWILESKYNIGKSELLERITNNSIFL
jgi:UDP-N-acetylmuramyl pentapeptide synthase